MVLPSCLRAHARQCEIGFAPRERVYSGLPEAEKEHLVLQLGTSVVAVNVWLSLGADSGYTPSAPSTNMRRCWCIR